MPRLLCAAITRHSLIAACSLEFIRPFIGVRHQYSLDLPSHSPNLRHPKSELPLSIKCEITAGSLTSNRDLTVACRSSAASCLLPLARSCADPVMAAAATRAVVQYSRHGDSSVLEYIVDAPVPPLKKGQARQLGRAARARPVHSQAGTPADAKFELQKQHCRF